MHPLPVSLLIINYNGAAHLRNCLAALASQTLPRYRFEVIVLDNASQDESGEIVVREFSWCRLVRSRQNLGFAEGNNLAKSYARGERLVLLNPDTVPDPNWLEELLRETETSSESRIVSKLVIGPDGRMMNSGGVVLLRSGWAADDGFRRLDDGRFERSRSVFAGCGAALSIPYRPGPIFPKDYFAYYEDVETAWASRAAGSTTRYAPRSVVMHAVGASAGERSPRFTFLTERNRLLTTVVHADPFLAAWATLKFAVKAISGALKSCDRHAFARLKALGSFLLRVPSTLVRRYDARSPYAGGIR